jgi:hypothetical protein
MYFFARDISAQLKGTGVVFLGRYYRMARATWPFFFRGLAFFLLLCLTL